MLAGAHSNPMVQLEDEEVWTIVRIRNVMIKTTMMVAPKKEMSSLRRYFSFQVGRVMRMPAIAGIMLSPMRIR